MMILRSGRLEWTALLTALAACGTEPDHGPVSLAAFGGDGQRSEVATALPRPIFIRIQHRDGPIEGASVAFAPGFGTDSVSPAKATSDHNGDVSFRWTLGDSAGRHTVSVSASGATAITVHATALPGPFASLDTASAMFQYALAARPVPTPPAVRPSDRFGNGIPGVPVVFSVSPAWGTVVGGVVTSDSTGVARVGSWRLGRIGGPQYLDASAGGSVARFVGFGTPATLTPVTPTQASVNVGTTVTPAPAVRAFDADGIPLSGVEVHFAITSGDGRLVGRSGSTSPDGTMQVRSWVVGLAAGPNVLEASTPGVPQIASFAATGVDATPAAINAVAGANRAGFFGNFVAAPPAVRVVDARGKPVGGKTVTFELVSGGGTITRATPALGPDGIAAVGSWRLGPAGNQELRATLTGLAPVSFPATATAAPASGYHIALRYIGTSLNQRQDSVLRSAAARWEELVVGDQPDVPLDLGEDPFGCYPAIHESVDDLLIFVQVQDIDGVGGILGAAGACLARDDTLLPIVGIFILDQADLSDLYSRGLLKDVMVHEMGHLLGFFDTMFRLKGWFSDEEPGNPVFLGPSTRGAYAAITPLSTTSLLPPLENTGGPGTVYSHWRESVFGTELMTGFIDPVNPLSAVTVAAMRDLGYTVNDVPADAFDLLSFLRAAPARAMVVPHTRPWPGPLRTVDARGRIRRVFR